MFYGNENPLREHIIYIIPGPQMMPQVSCQTPITSNDCGHDTSHTLIAKVLRRELQI